MKKIAIFASGNGTNAEATIKELEKSAAARIAVIITNNPSAGVIGRAQRLGVPVDIIDKAGREVKLIEDILTKYEVTTILLLGYLKLFPAKIVSKYEGHILNLHPALLPKYGGKGMYGHYVHEAVAASSDNETGLSLHRVNNKFDDGEVLFQQSVNLPENATAEDVEKLERQLELTYVAKAVRQLIETNQI